jgi:hypothetical protein
MFEVRVAILGESGIYPKETVLCNEVGYACFDGIPLWFSVRDKEAIKSYRDSSKQTILKASFQFTNREFPLYKFHSNDNKATIFISSVAKPNLRETLLRVKLILKGTIKPPALYSPDIRSVDSYDERMRKIKAIREQPEYIDLFNCKRMPIAKLLNDWRRRYCFAKHNPCIRTVKNYYNLLEQSTPMVHIALYYYDNAASLVRDDYIEDAGINLHLAVEAIIKDFMKSHSVKDKRKAVGDLISKIWPPDWGTDYLEDLWKSRNRFLAHIDENMFTDDQSISDPDEYCYDTFESVSYLITRYAEYIKGEAGEGGGCS